MRGGVSPTLSLLDTGKKLAQAPLSTKNSFLDNVSYNLGRFTSGVTETIVSDLQSTLLTDWTFEI